MLIRSSVEVAYNELNTVFVDTERLRLKGPYDDLGIESSCLSFALSG